MAHKLHIQGAARDLRNPFTLSAGTDLEHRDAIRSWLAALLGAEHVSLLLGSGLGVALASAAGTTGLDMSAVTFDGIGPKATTAIDKHATATAASARRGRPNIEDQLRAAIQLLEGARVLDPEARLTTSLATSLDATLSSFAGACLDMERELRDAYEAESEGGIAAMDLLVSLLLAFAGRPPTRDRVNLFTTNYDRLIEYGADLAGLRVLDRFVGGIEPIFRSSRLDVDLHYNPPGIRGEPRFLEGVLRLFKLHGSLDWRFDGTHLRRAPLAFGGTDPSLAKDALSRLMIYPNAAKDVETLQYPYAELFRDLAASLCRPNSVLFTYGYGFGDEHINRIIRDMLTLSSTHLAVISFDDAEGRIPTFLAGRPPAQYTLLQGKYFGALDVLVREHLPQLGSDPALARQVQRQKALGGAPSGDTTPDRDEGNEDEAPGDEGSQ
ncbi:SIR2 family protein [Patulibacter sp. NPDC049589]|uniref:SIR2 family protein n=1 Tax=Patulibacter sp. NPDC049589 TaxID=3154731 RepID=UPI00342DA047